MTDIMKKIVFIDRDGVINVDLMGDYVKTWDEFRFEEGALEGLKLIHELGYEIIIISNQAGVGEGIFPETELWNIHNRMLRELEAYGIPVRSSHYCLHGKDAGCSCRKPATGLLEEAVRGITYNPAETFLIGDKATDIEAAKRFGIRTIFVRTGHGKSDESKLKESLVPDFRADHLKAAAEVLKQCA